MSMLGRPGRAPGWHAPAGVAALLLLALLSNRFSDLDLWLAHRFGSAAGFPWREHWLAAGLLHGAARQVSLVLVLALLSAWLASWLPGRRRLERARAPIAFTLASVLAAAWLVSTLKHLSQHSCPWDLQAFGGTAEFFRLLTPPPAHAGPGQCLPSGHSSTGFMWIGALYAAARWPRRAPWAAWPRWRGVWLAFALATSLAQVVRGAHFLSHVLIGAAVCWAVAWLFDQAAEAVLARRAPAGGRALGALRTARALPARPTAHRAARRRPGGAARWP